MLAVIAFLVAVGFGVMVPVLPVFARSFRVTNFQVGLVVSSFAFLRLVMSPWCGRLNSWLGERTALGIGMFIVAASTAVAGLSRSFVQLLVFRALGGLGSAMFTVAAMTLLLRSVDAPLRGRASSVYSGGFLLGGMAGPAVGGLLATISLTAPFFFYAGTLAVAGLVGLFVLSPPRRADGNQRGEPDSIPLAVAFSDVRYRAACWTNFAQGWQSFGVRSSLVPVLVVEVLHRPPSWTGTAFAVAAVAQTVALAPAGRVVDTVGRRPVMIAGALFTGAAGLAIPWAPSIWVLTAVLCVYGVGSAMLSTAPTAVVGDVVGSHGATPIAVFSMTSDVGAILGPLVAGWLADAVSMTVAFTVGGVFLLAGAAYSWLMPRAEVVRPVTVP